MLELNPGLLRFWHWQSDALTIRQDRIHSSHLGYCYQLFFICKNVITEQSQATKVEEAVAGT
jgi:hypothetical protein